MGQIENEKKNKKIRNKKMNEKEIMKRRHHKLLHNAYCFVARPRLLFFLLLLLICGAAKRVEKSTIFLKMNVDEKGTVFFFFGSQLNIVMYL